MRSQHITRKAKKNDELCQQARELERILLSQARAFRQLRLVRTRNLRAARRSGGR